MITQEKLTPINEEFLINNLFEKSKISCGYSTWWYEDKKYSVVVAPWTDCGDIYFTIANKESGETLTFEKRKGMKLTQEDLHKCILFIGVPDEFEYDS